MGQAVGLRQTVPDVRQSDSGGGTGREIVPLAVPIVGNLDADALALAAGGDPDVGTVLARRYRIFDRILDQRLEQERRQPRADRLGVDPEMRAKPVLEAHLLNLEI